MRRPPHLSVAAALRRVLRRSTPGRAFVPVAAAVALVLGAGVFWALAGQASDDAPAPTDARSLLQTSGALIVYSEFGEQSDTLWAADPADPAQRAELGTVPHAPGVGIFPALSPDGTYVAYTVARNSELDADLALLDIASGDTRTLLSGVDLRATPVWAPDGSAIAVRRSAGVEGEAGAAELLRVDLSGNVTPLAGGAGGLYAIEFSPDGDWLYYASLTPAGSDLGRAAGAGGGTETIAHLSDGFARDWDLSPDGSKLAYLGETASSGKLYVAHVLDLETGAIETPLATTAGAEFKPLWQPDGQLAIGRIAGDRGGVAELDAAGAVIGEIEKPGAGFDVPLASSADGTYLIVRAFGGASVSDPGPSRVEVIGPDGARRALSDLADVAIAGWLEAAS